MKTILEELSPITSADTNFEGNIKVSAMVNKLIQLAWHHAEELDFGPSFMHKEQVFWVLSSMHIDFFDFPAWNSDLKLTTWPKGIERLFYLRDFEVADARNKPVALASSKWLILNAKTKRPKLYQPENTIFIENADKHALSEAVPTIQLPDESPEIYHNRVQFSDLDLNQHLTTTRYVDWMIDTFSLDYLKRFMCATLSMNFIREIPYNQKVVLKRFKNSPEENYIFEFQSEDGKQIYFRGQSGFTSVKV